MLMTTALICYLLGKGPIPAKIYLKDGRWLANTTRLQLDRGRLTIRGSAGVYYVLSHKTVDLVRSLTFPPQVGPGRKKNPVSFIPWDHPLFQGLDEARMGGVALTTEGLLARRRRKRRLGNRPDTGAPRPGEAAESRAEGPGETARPIQKGADVTPNTRAPKKSARQNQRR